MRKTYDAKRLGPRLRELRSQADLSMAQLARQTGIGERTLFRFEANERYPGWDVVVTLANFFGVSLEEIATGATGQVEARKPGRPKRAE